MRDWINLYEIERNLLRFKKSIENYWNVSDAMEIKP